MTKMEYQNEIDNVNIELRSLMDSVKDTSKEINLEEVRAKKAELEEKRSSLVKQMAECDRPLPKEEEKTVWRQIAEGMIEHRTVSLSGTGVVNTLKELVKKVVSKTDVLDGVRFFYGPNAATKIPVWGSQLKAHFVSEGASSSGESNTAGVSSVDAQEILSSLPVTQMMLDLGAASLAEELPGLFEDAISDLLADGMCVGKTITVGGETVVAMVGVFAVSNATAFSAQAKIVKLGEFARNMASKKYKNPKIVMSNAVYTLFLSDNSTDETTKIYKEDMIRNKKIEEVAIELTDYAPSTGSGASGAWADNDVIAVAMDKSNYAIGMAGQLKIKQKETAGSTVSTFDATAYAAGKPILAADIHQFKIDV